MVTYPCAKAHTSLQDDWQEDGYRGSDGYDEAIWQQPKLSANRHARKCASIALEHLQ